MTYWTARVAMLLLALGFALRMASSRRPGWLRVTRWIWTLGCVIYLVHVACAFQFVHHWSHSAAHAATASQTLHVVGLRSGAGLYASYAFTLVWLGDVCWWWLGPRSYETRSTVIEWIIQGFLGFMAFNATVVFANGITRWAGVLVCFILLAAWPLLRRSPSSWITT